MICIDYHQAINIFLHSDYSLTLSSISLIIIKLFVNF